METVVVHYLTYKRHWLMTQSTHQLRQAAVEEELQEEESYISMSVISSESKEMSAQMGWETMLVVRIKIHTLHNEIHAECIKIVGRKIVGRILC